MNADQWKRIDELLNEALEIAPEERPAFLDKACDGDAELRKEIESLLAADDTEQNRIEGYTKELAADLLAEQRMVLQSGHSIGPYKILSMVGSGGMGEVYRATDSRIGRDVAIKILPPHFSQDTDRVRRFEQEARAAGMLNHPNIVSIYDAGTSNGSPYLVSELLHGEVLQEKLKGHPLPVRKATDYALQIAKGLSAAHEKGIIHRDLKPGNIFITKEGTVKILDFGLAKLTHPDTPATPSAETQTIEQTESGVVLGTVVYMSPEQVTGRKVDRRSDIFAFGSLLFEMLSGKRPFGGETQIEIMHAILKADPAELSEIPPPLQRIVQRCLEKHPDRRFQSTSDLAFALEALSSLSGTAIVPLGRKNLVPLAWVFSALLLVLSAILGVALYRSSKTTKAQEYSSAPQRLSIVLPQNTVLNSSAISPDGKRVAYVTNETTGFSTLWLRSLDSNEAEKIAGTEDATFPFWSPDSKAIGFFTERALKTVIVGGGPPRTLYDGPVEIAKGGAWNQYGDIIFSPKSGVGLMKITARGGEATAATDLDASRAEVRHLFPEFLPDGRHFLYLVRSPRKESAVVFMASLDSKEKKIVLPYLTPVRFIDPGYLFFVRSNKLMVQPFDLKRLEFRGEALTITNNASTDISGPNFSVARNNILIHGNPNARQQHRGTNNEWATQPSWFDRSGKRMSPHKTYPFSIGEPGSYIFCDLSPDDSRLLTFWNDALWMAEMATGNFSRYSTTNEASVACDPDDAAFSPDGTQVVYSVFEKAAAQLSLFRKPSNGVGKVELLLPHLPMLTDISWGGDGKFITFTSVTPAAKTLFDLWALPLQGDRKAFSVLQTPSRDESPVLSPDGRWVAYHSYESGLPEVYVRSFPDQAGGVWQISTGGAERPIWRRDGKELFYLTLDKRLMATEVQTGETFKAGATRFLFQTHSQPRINPWGIGGSKQYFASSDGNHFLINRLVDRTTPTEINVLLNWKAMLKD